MGGNAGAARTGAGGYLAEEAGDHLLEGVLVHLAHVHRDPHPRTPAPGSAAAAGAHTRPAKGAGKGFFPPFSNFGNFIVLRQEQTGSRAPPPSATAGCGRRASGGGGADSGVWALQAPGAARSARGLGATAPGSAPLEPCFSVVTSPELLQTQQP